MPYLLSTAAVLFGFWLLLSGFYTPFMLGVGVLSVVVVVAFVWRMEVVDHEGHPVHLGWRAVVFFPWLMWQILKAGWQVSRIILTPSLPISPTLAPTRASQKTTVGMAAFANSITLTPGTISVETGDEEILVHALTEEAMSELQGGEMNRRVVRMEGTT